MRYFLGIVAGIISGLAFAAASIAQKRAMNEIKAESPLFRNLIASPLWLAGFAAAFALGAPLNMAAYVALGPTLPPALSSIGLAAVPFLARSLLGERPPARSFAGATAIAVAIACIGRSGIAIRPESVDWVDPSFLLRAAIAVGGIVAFAGACLVFGLRSRSDGAVPLALAAGAAQALVNAFMAPIAGQLGRLVSGALGGAGLIMAGVSGLALFAANMGAIAVAQLALRKGRAATVVPIQQLPIQAFPLMLHAALYRESFGGAAETALLGSGLVLLIAGAYALGAVRVSAGKGMPAASAGIVLLFALAVPHSLSAQESAPASRVYRYASLDEAGRTTATTELRLTARGRGTEIASTDSEGRRGYAMLDAGMRQEEVRIDDARGGTTRFRLDESGRSWTVEDGSARFLSAADEACIGDWSLFFILPGLIDPSKKGSEARFVLVRPEGGQRATMRLRAEGAAETPSIGGRRERAYRISMELADPIGRLFWPFSYNYYYRVGDYQFLAYEGPDENKRPSRIILAEGQE